MPTRTNHGIIPPLPSGRFRLDSNASDSAIFGAIFSKNLFHPWWMKEFSNQYHAENSVV